MTTAFGTDDGKPYSPDVWETIGQSTQIFFNRCYELFPHDSECYKLAKEHRNKMFDIRNASQRHSVPLNTSGYTSPENGCHLCGKAMHYTELDKLAERGLPPDTCLRCHHNDECPTCHGDCVVGTGKRLLSHDWHDAPEYDTSRCEDCNGCGDYDSYCVVNGVE